MQAGLLLLRHNTISSLLNPVMQKGIDQLARFFVRGTLIPADQTFQLGRLQQHQCIFQRIAAHRSNIRYTEAVSESRCYSQKADGVSGKQPDALFD
ncbi:hypothetical protein D3C86_1815870 [compost metagenome]